MKPQILIASDHAGFCLKMSLQEHFADRFDFIDLGADSLESADYPVFGRKLAEAITEGKAQKGILVCGTGIGISIAANRFPAVRAALCTDVTMARLTRLHNDANVLALGERITGTQTAFDIVEAFFETEFEGGRHQRRVDLLSRD